MSTCAHVLAFIDTTQSPPIIVGAGIFSSRGNFYDWLKPFMGRDL